MAWTLEHNGATKTLAEWKLSQVKRSLVSQAPDTVTCVAPGRDYDQAPLFAFGDTVTIFKDGMPWFQGRLVQNPLDAAIAHHHSYIFAGPWWYLEKWLFQRPWIVNQGGVLVTQYTSHVVLNLKAGNLLGTTTEQIVTALQYALDSATATGVQAPFQIGSILAAGNSKPAPTLYPPTDEIRDYTCAEVVRKQLRWHPSAVVWFDYTTTPPTLHIQERDRMDFTALDVSKRPDIRLTPRDDLIVPSVAIRYEIRSTFNNQTYLSLVNDVAPAAATGRELGALSATIDLLGPSTRRMTARIETETIRADSFDLPTRLAWWKQRRPTLDVPNTDLLAIDQVTRKTGSSNHVEELMRGQIAPWMLFLGSSVQAEDEVISAVATYKIYDRDKTDPDKEIVFDAVKVPISYACKATNANTGTFVEDETIAVGEPVPVGLASYLYEALKSRQWEGQFTLREAEISGLITMGKLISFAGAQPLGTVTGLIQRIDEDIDAAVTTVSIGPPPHLTVQDLVELLRAVRNRARDTNSGTFDDGSLTSAGDMELGRHTPTANTNHSEGNVQRQRFFAGAAFTLIDMVDGKVELGDGNVKLELDLNQPAWKTAPTASRTLFVQEVEVCVSGVTKRMLVIGSAPWTPSPGQ